MVCRSLLWAVRTIKTTGLTTEMKTIHVTGQYFLNHLLEEQELRKQVKLLAAAGYESIYGHARQGLKTPYFSEAWWDVHVGSR